MKYCPAQAWICSALALSTALAPAQPFFTLEVGSAQAPAFSLVAHGDTWHFHKGTNAVQNGWQTIPDFNLDTTWAAGPGGFGYATDNTAETVYCRTLLPDMTNNYSTLYLRKSFALSAAPDPGLHLHLRMDFDDSFIAWLDGNYLTNFNVAGAPAEPSHTNTATATHEASTGNNGPQPAITFDLGAVGSRLGPGTHVLAIMGLNQSTASSDFIQVADLELAGGQLTVANGKFFSLVRTNSVTLSGTNTIPGSTRVVINGDDIPYSTAQGTWNAFCRLAPGMNHFYVAALDTAGHLLASTNRDVICELSSTAVSGTLSTNSTWSPAMGTVHVAGTVLVPSGVSLSLQPGSIVLVSAAASIQANASSFTALGSPENPIYFLPEDGTSEWGELSASGSGSLLTLSNVDVTAGRVRFGSGANGVLAESLFHENYSGASILSSAGARSLTVRRIHVRDYFDINFNSTLMLAEDSLFENVFLPSSDAFEMSDSPPGLVVRRVTVRHILGSNSDAVDFNGARNVLVDSCLLHDVSDKGISIGAACAGCASSFGVTVTNCLVYSAGIGSAIKDGSTASFYQNTIVNSGSGLSLYPKYTPQGGHITNAFNNIIWNNTVPVLLSNDASALLAYSDVQGTNWPGTGNLDADPLFTDPAAHDFSLRTNSPCVGSGMNGADLGFLGPIGGLPGAPLNLAALCTNNAPVLLTWVNDADNELGFRIERSEDHTNWATVTTVGPTTSSLGDSTALPDRKYYYRVCATNFSGDSAFSNVAAGARASGEVAGASADGQLHLSFYTLPAVSYTIQARETFAPETPWTDAFQVSPGLGGNFTWTNSLPVGSSHFFRVVSP